MPRIYLPQPPRYLAVEENNIILLEGGKVYSTVITVSESILIRRPLSVLHEQLGNSRFCRVHNAYVISLAHIVYFTPELINLGSREVPVGRKYRDAFYDCITVLGK
jgi:DNA-binding LytR/AlgR family response regulator